MQLFLSLVINVAFIAADPSAASQIRTLFEMVQIVEWGRHRVRHMADTYLKHLFAFITYVFFF
jgi:hypothetical protein